MNPTPSDRLPTREYEFTQGEPVQIDGEDLLPATCLVCRKVAWHLPSGMVSDGRAMLLDSEISADQLYLFLHGCHFEEGYDEFTNYDLNYP